MSQKQLSLVEIAQNAHRDLNVLPYPALPNREIARRVLHLANDCTDEQKEEALLISMLSHGIPSKDAEKLSRLHGGDYLRRAWDSIFTERIKFREQVELVFANRAKARKALRNEVVAQLGDVVPVPKLTLTKNWNVVPELRYFAKSLPAACAFGLALLLDESEGLGAALSKCKLSLCPNFFLSLASPSGGRPPKYCCRDHQLEYAAQSGAARTERWRQRRANEGGKKG